MINILTFALLVSSNILILSIVICLFRFLNSITRKFLFSRVEQLYIALEYSKEVVFEKIFQEDILVFNTSGVTLNQTDLHKFQTKYVKLLLQYLGNDLVSDLVKIHGNLDSVCMILASEFIIKLRQKEYLLKSPTNMLHQDGR